MKKKLVFEENEKLMPLSIQEIERRKVKMEETVKRNMKIKVFYRPDMEKLSIKLKEIRKEYEEEKNKKRIIVIDLEESIFFK